MRRRIALEVGITSVQEAVLAARSGADRLELCSALDVGGLTPSPGTFLAVREAVQIPVYVLLRPRVGGFTYSDDQFDTMRRDAEWFLGHGADGIVFGILKVCDVVNRIDMDRCRRLVDLATGKAVFHRAFDFLPSPFLALEELIKLDFERVQSSGGCSSAEAGMNRLAACVAHASGRLGILPAGGIRPDMVAGLLRVTRADQVHASLRVGVPDPSVASNPGLASAMGVADHLAGWRTTDAQMIEQMRNELDDYTAHMDGAENVHEV